MFKKGDLIYKKIVDEKNKKQGFSEDICIDFIDLKLIGLKVSSSRLFKGYNYLDLEDVISIGEVIKCERLTKSKGMMFSELMHMEVEDKNKCILGEIEDIIISEEDFGVKGIIINTGLINKLINGRRIMLIQDLFFLENSIIYKGNPKIEMVNMPCRGFL